MRAACVNSVINYKRVYFTVFCFPKNGNCTGNCVRTIMTNNTKAQPITLLLPANGRLLSAGISYYNFTHYACIKIKHKRESLHAH